MVLGRHNCRKHDPKYAYFNIYHKRETSLPNKILHSAYLLSIDHVLTFLELDVLHPPNILKNIILELDKKTLNSLTYPQHLVVMS